MSIQLPTRRLRVLRDDAGALCDSRREVGPTFLVWASRTKYEYDDEYRLEHEEWSGTNIADGEYEYLYDANGNRTDMTKDTIPTEYAYDPRTNAIKSALTSDAAGTSNSYKHDFAGNRTEKTVTADGATTVTRYTYDQFNRLVAADKRDAAGTWTTVFRAVYDYRTRRAWKYELAEGKDKWTHFRYDGGVSFDEWTDDEDTGEFGQSVYFIRGAGMGGGIGSIIYSDRSAMPEEMPDPVEHQVEVAEHHIDVLNDQKAQTQSVIDKLLAKGKASPNAIAAHEQRLVEIEISIVEYEQQIGQLKSAFSPVEYFVYNPAVGHVVATVSEVEDTNGAPMRVVKSMNVYEAFGSVVSDSGTSDNNRLANTKEFDGSLGLFCHGFRHYDPELGCYVVPEHWYGLAADINLYRYVFNNPVNRSDPVGLCTGDLQCRLFAGLSISTDTGRGAFRMGGQLRYSTGNQDESGADIDAEFYYGEWSGGPGTVSSDTSSMFGARIGATYGWDRGTEDPIAGVGPGYGAEPNEFGSTFGSSVTAAIDFYQSPRGTSRRSLLLGFSRGNLDVEIANDWIVSRNDSEYSNVLSVAGSLPSGDSLALVAKVFTGVRVAGETTLGSDGETYYRQGASERKWNNAEWSLRYTAEQGALSLGWGTNAPEQRLVHPWGGLPLFPYDNIGGLYAEATPWMLYPQDFNDDDQTGTE